MTSKPKQPHDGRTRAALYVRVAREEKRDASVVAWQQARLEAFCREQLIDVVGLYTDVGSGVTLARPGLQRALADANEHRFDVLIVKRLDRLSRRWDQTAEIIKQLKAAGVSVRALDGFDSATPAAVLKQQIADLTLEIEAAHRQLIGERVRAGKARARNARESGASPQPREQSLTDREEESD